MFSRRKTRSVHDTAYTGVSGTAPNNHQPNSGALAAALTIGNAMKQQQPAQAAKKNSSIARSQSFQVAPPAANISESGGSLLKRGSRSSMQSKDKAGSTWTATKKVFCKFTQLLCLGWRFIQFANSTHTCL